MKLTEVGFSSYYSLSLFSFWAGVINSHEFLYRMNWLRNAHDVDDNVLKRLVDEFPTIKEFSMGYDNYLDNWESDISSNISLKKTRSQSLPEADDIYFLITSAGVLGDKWKFNPYDSDYFPSVPHGHLQSKHHTKLDAYLGFTYDTLKNNKALKRESRNFIINLWNDDKFRTMARSAIEYYLVHHPNFTGWRVAEPLHLPKKR